MAAKNVVCTTTFRQGNPENPIERVRTEVFIDTVKKMAGFGLPLVVVYIETQNQILDEVKELGAILVSQQSSGMGNIRKEALRAALDKFPNAKHLCWLEPEKPDMVQFIEPMHSRMIQEQSSLGMFNRVDMSSYPPEQAHYYLFCRAVASQLIGFDLDYAFTRPATAYFLEYQGEYGNKWDSILIPRLRVIKAGAGISTLLICFRNDPRMTQAELGNEKIILKRIEQLNNVIPSLIAEWQKLKTA
ncbi:MAG: hypothetical protein WC643_00685 [Parcubacteria group bacterium]|jgi:hypothetical protein